MLAAAPPAALGLGVVREASARVTRLAALAGAATAAVGLAHGPGSTGASTRLDRACDPASRRAARSSPRTCSPSRSPCAGARSRSATRSTRSRSATRRPTSHFLLGEPGGDVDVARARVVLVQRHGAAERRIARNPRFAVVGQGRRRRAVRPAREGAPVEHQHASARALEDDPHDRALHPAAAAGAPRADAVPPRLRLRLQDLPRTRATRTCTATRRTRRRVSRC